MQSSLKPQLNPQDVKDVLYHLGTYELYLLVQAAKGFDAQKPFEPVFIGVVDIQEHFRVIKDEQKLAKRLVDAGKTLFGSVVSVKNKVLPNIPLFESHDRLIYGFDFSEESGAFYVLINPYLVSHVLQFFEAFGGHEYDPDKFKNKLSNYARRLADTLGLEYRPFKQNTSILSEVSVDLARLRQGFGLHIDEYARMSDFKRFVLDPAVAELDKFFNRPISYTQSKDGKVITGFTFVVGVVREDQSA